MISTKNLGIVLVFTLMISLGSLSFPFVAQAQEYQLTVAAGPIGAGWFTSMTGLFEVVHKYAPEIKAKIVPGGGTGNQPRVGAKEVDLAWGITPFVDAAIKGEKPFDQAYKDIMCIMKANDVFALQFIALKDSPFNSIDDIFLKKYPLKLAVAPEGVSDSYAFRKLLEFYNLDIKNIESWGGKIMRAGYPDQIELLKDKHVEALFENTFVPSNPVLQLQPFRKLKYIPFEKKHIDYFKRIGFVSWEIPANSYEGQSLPVPTVASGSVLIVNRNIPNEAVYKLTKILVEKAAEIRKVQTLEKWDPKTGVKDMPGPLHPGAEKYLREAGLL